MSEGTGRTYLTRAAALSTISRKGEMRRKVGWGGNRGRGWNRLGAKTHTEVHSANKPTKTEMNSSLSQKKRSIERDKEPLLQKHLKILGTLEFWRRKGNGFYGGTKGNSLRLSEQYSVEDDRVNQHHLPSIIQRR